MAKRIGFRIAITLTLLLLPACSDNDDLFVVPDYPNATRTESMQQEGVLGLGGGSLQQSTTADSYDDVLEFYLARLGDAVEVVTHTTAMGRQAALTRQDGGASITVAIQEFTAEDVVNITVMRLTL